MEELFAAHYGWALSYARRLVGSSFDAEDVVSNVLVGVVAARERGGGPSGNVRGYLASALRNEATRVYARRAGTVTTDVVPEVVSADAFAARERALDRERVLDRAPSLWRQVLWLVDVAGFSRSEAAERLDMSVSAVASLLFRARSAVRVQ